MFELNNGWGKLTKYLSVGLHNLFIVHTSEVKSTDTFDFWWALKLENAWHHTVNIGLYIDVFYSKFRNVFFISSLFTLNLNVCLNFNFNFLHLIYAADVDAAYQQNG